METRVVRHVIKEGIGEWEVWYVECTLMSIGNEVTNYGPCKLILAVEDLTLFWH
jgi:hypothetical protein